MTRILAAALLVVAAGVLLVLAWPQLFGLATAPVIAQLVSLRALVVVVGLVAVVALTLVALLSAGARRFLASLALAALVFCAINVVVLATRGFGNEAFETRSDSDITVLVWNTLGDAPSPELIAQLALESGADVIALPETTRATALEVARLMTDAGAPMAHFTAAYDEVSKSRSTSLLISVELGEYAADETAVTTATLPSLVATPVDGTGPIVVAVHAVAPIPGEMEHWRTALRWLAGRCTGGNVILAGDFNSTLDHYGGLGTDGGTLGTCEDAALATDNGAIGTWPTQLPAILGAPIDHVMASPDWRVSGMRVVQSHDGYGSDHRPVLVQLSPAG
ncbi:MAG: endonuclease/exonuclease/phosphatase family protein [Rhodoglobus sp.]